LVNLIAPSAEIVFIDTGHSSSSYINLSNKYNILFDAGGRMNFANPQIVSDTKTAEYLTGRGVSRIDLAVLTHGDFDHIGGMRAVIDSIKVDTILVSGAKDPELEELLDYASYKGVKIIRLWAGDVLTIGECANLEIISPFSENYDELGYSYFVSLNDSSLVTKLTYMDMSILYCGDIGINAENLILQHGTSSVVDIIDVPHHGSKNSNSKDFIAAANPLIAVFEVGANSFGHPNEDVVSKYQDIDAVILRTDNDGTITIRYYSGGGGYRISRFNSVENQYAWLAWRK
jgi:competence protein ComEC